MTYSNTTNDIQQNDTQHDDIQQNDTQNYDIQYSE